jgi:blue copper oxidase
MNSSRRRFLSRIAFATACAAAERTLGPLLPRARGAQSGAGNPLRIPATLTGDELVAERRSVEVWPGTTTVLSTFGGGWPGPTVRARRGDELRVRLVNRLGEPTNIHWHGLLAPAEMDGHPMHVVEPGASRDYHFTIDQPAGTYWYHPHAHMLTAKQVYLGMAGLVIVDDRPDASPSLPTGAHDLPLVVQDRRFDASEGLTYEPTMIDTMSGMLGSALFVNGTPDAYHEVSRDLYRLRILNGSNARIYRFGLDDGSSFQLIASDGGLLDRSYVVDDLWLAPGERAEILVDFTTRPIGSSLTLRSLAYNNAASASFQGWLFDVVRFDVTSERTVFTDAPTTFLPIEPVAVTAATRQRTMRMAMVHVHPSMRHTINGRVYEMDRVDERVPAGSTEVWELINEDNDEPHPMHLHGARFQIIERNGSTDLAPGDRGWKDTVLVDPIRTVKVAVAFSEHEGLFVAHCHNLEHEDSGMMINVLVEPTSHVRIDDGAEELSVVSVAPNPVVDHVRLGIAAPEPGRLTIELFDASGRRVRSFVHSAQVGGTVVDAHLDLVDLPAACYHVRVTQGARHAETTLTVVR